MTIEPLCPQIQIKKYNYLTMGIWWNHFYCYVYILIIFSPLFFNFFCLYRQNSILLNNL